MLSWLLYLESFITLPCVWLLMKLDFEKMNGLIPAVIQDYKTNEVLMVGFMNKAAWDKTIKMNKVTFYSRTRKELWTKGETSGNYLLVKKIYVDCDNDTVLIKVEPKGPTCHTGSKTCFFKEVK